MTETIELIDWLGDGVAQSFRSFADGAQASDAPDFLPVAFQASKGIGGFFKNAKLEAEAATVEEIDAAWKRQEAKIIAAGAAPMAAATIMSGFRTVHFGYSWAVQSAKDPRQVEVRVLQS